MRAFTAALFALTLFAAPPALGQTCERHPTCTKMRSCAEADFYFRQCGDTERDGDGDGIPCEDLCGKTMADYLERREKD